jgi:hypothetical protein
VARRVPKREWRWMAQMKAIGLSHRREDRNTNVGEGCRPPRLPAKPTVAHACCCGQKHRPAQAHLGPSRPRANYHTCRSASAARQSSQDRRHRNTVTVSPLGHAPSPPESYRQSPQSLPGLCLVGRRGGGQERRTPAAGGAIAPSCLCLGVGVGELKSGKHGGERERDREGLKLPPTSSPPLLSPSGLHLDFS